MIVGVGGKINRMPLKLERKGDKMETEAGKPGAAFTNAMRSIGISNPEDIKNVCDSRMTFSAAHRWFTGKSYPSDVSLLYIIGNVAPDNMSLVNEIKSKLDEEYFIYKRCKRRGSAPLTPNIDISFIREENREKVIKFCEDNGWIKYIDFHKEVTEFSEYSGTCIRYDRNRDTPYCAFHKYVQLQLGIMPMMLVQDKLFTLCGHLYRLFTGERHPARKTVQKIMDHYYPDRADELTNIIMAEIEAEAKAKNKIGYSPDKYPGSAGGIYSGIKNHSAGGYTYPSNEEIGYEPPDIDFATITGKTKSIRNTAWRKLLEKNGESGVEIALFEASDEAVESMYKAGIDTIADFRAVNYKDLSTKFADIPGEHFKTVRDSIQSIFGIELNNTRWRLLQKNDRVDPDSIVGFIKLCKQKLMDLKNIPEENTYVYSVYINDSVIYAMVLIKVPINICNNEVEFGVVYVNNVYYDEVTGMLNFYNAESNNEIEIEFYANLAENKLIEEIVAEDCVTKYQNKVETVTEFLSRVESENAANKLFTSVNDLAKKSDAGKPDAITDEQLHAVAYKYIKGIPLIEKSERQKNLVIDPKPIVATISVAHNGVGNKVYITFGNEIKATSSSGTVNEWIFRAVEITNAYIHTDGNNKYLKYDAIDIIAPDYKFRPYDPKISTDMHGYNDILDLLYEIDTRNPEYKTTHILDKYRTNIAGAVYSDGYKYNVNVYNSVIEISKA